MDSFGKQLSRAGCAAFLVVALASCATLERPGVYEPPLAGDFTELDAYIAAPDPNFRFRVVNELEGHGYTGYVIDLTSQAWLTPEVVEPALWQHWLTVLVPDEPLSNTALLQIGGGSNGREAPTQVDARLAQIVQATGSVVAHLGQVPNQPLTFAGQEEGLYEDAQIAYAWEQFMLTGHAEWLSRFPMTKAAVAAMDTVQILCAEPAYGGHSVDDFVVMGGSKRGWTTWTAAAVDERVRACIPIVIDLLNVVPSFEHHFRVYGFWAPAVGDYERQGIMEWMGSPEYDELIRLVEPFSYRERLTMPKFIVNATGDEFFLPDSSQFYWDDLEGPKYLRYVPNAGHNLRDSDAGESVLSFYASILTGAPLPEMSWEFPDAGTIRVHSATRPEAVHLWKATNPAARDFRFRDVGAIWAASPLTAVGPGVYEARVAEPVQGWTAFMIELTYPGPGGVPLKLTTPVRVVPDVTPFEYEPPAVPRRGFLSR